MQREHSISAVRPSAAVTPVAYLHAEEVHDDIATVAARPDRIAVANRIEADEAHAALLLDIEYTLLPLGPLFRSQAAGSQHERQCLLMWRTTLTDSTKHAPACVNLFNTARLACGRSWIFLHNTREALFPSKSDYPSLQH